MKSLSGHSTFSLLFYSFFFFYFPELLRSNSSIINFTTDVWNLDKALGKERQNKQKRGGKNTIIKWREQGDGSTCTKQTDPGTGESQERRNRKKEKSTMNVIWLGFRRRRVVAKPSCTLSWKSLVVCFMSVAVLNRASHFGVFTCSGSCIKRIQKARPYVSDLKSSKRLMRFDFKEEENFKYEENKV